MSMVLILAAVVVLLIAMGMYQSFRAHVRHHGYLPVLWRWFSGRQHHGIKQDNKRRYMQEYDPLHQGYNIRLRLHKAIQRTGWTLGLPLLGLTIFTQSPKIGLLTIFFIVMLAAEAIWRVRNIQLSREVDKKTIRPLHRTLGPEVGVPLSTRPGQWITVSPDRQTVRAELPKNYHPTEAAKNKISSIIRDSVGMAEDSLITWGLKDNDSYVEVKTASPPPNEVKLADVLPAIKTKNHDEIVLGIGRGNEIIKASLAEDSPHFGLSIAGGGGKSQLARLAAAEVANGGGIALILDVKRLSHAWARDLPNIRYARTVEEIHEALIWLDYEINRRTLVADVGVDVEGEVLANVGPRLLVVAEELNETMVRLRRYWAEIKKKDQPRKSPAIEALEEALFMGRQVKINMFAVAQMMTALAAGSGAARENMGIRILGRYTRNAWRMLVPEHDMPPRSVKPGRIQVVTSKVQECQVAFITGAEARELSVSGTVTPFPKAPEAEVEPETLPFALPATTSEIITEEPVLITLPEAVMYCPGKNLKALQNARLRDPNFPKSVGNREGARGRPNLYDLADIRRWNNSV